MLETSTDLLKIILAASIGVFTLFLCWGLFYFIMTLRNILLVTKDARRLFDKVDSVLEALKDKIHSSTSYLMVIGEVLKKILSFMNSGDSKFNFPKFGKKKKDPKKKQEAEADEDKEEEDVEDEEDTW